MTATDTMIDLLAECSDLMKHLAARVNGYRPTCKTATWPKTGDIEHVRNLLHEAVEFLT